MTIAFQPSAFVPGESVVLSLIGENASAATLALVVKTAVQTATLGRTSASTNGAAPAFDVRLPANASGNYIFTAFAPSVPGGISTTIAVAAAGGG